MSAHSETERHRIHDIQEYGLDCKHFVIYLQGVEEQASDDYTEPGVEYRMANRFIKNLDVLTGIDSGRPITISMKTCGGDWEEGIAMYDAILATPNPVTIINYTHARSMSSIILQAANKRIMMPHSSFMFHMGYLGIEGTPKQVDSSWHFNKIADRQMIEIYIDALKRTPHGKMHSWSRKRIEEWLREQMDKREDVYFTAEDAVKAGFADEIFTDWDVVTQYTEDQLARKA